MRLLGNHYATKAVPARAKKERGSLVNLTAPLKGLSLATTASEGDAQTAVVLKNFVVDDDRISVRAGYLKKATRGTLPVWAMIPYYGQPPTMAAASNHEIWNAQNGTLIRGGFSSDDWHWTSFSNLGDREYTVMVNGVDGVWSWDGGNAAQGAAKVVTSLSSATEAVCTVSATDIATFANGMRVVIAGADAAHAVANGSHYIKSVGSPANTFTLVGVNTVSAGTAQTTGVTASVAGSMTKENILVDPADTFISPNSFQVVLSHMNRLFFADGSNLAVYYLPLLAKEGMVAYLPLNNVFKRGGSIRAMYTWTVEGGTNLNDQLVIFTTNGECAIYGGVDPDTDFTLTGLFRFDAPMSKHSVVNYGGELYVLISTGLVPMSTLMKAETDHLGIQERNIVAAFLQDAIQYRTDQGWQAFLNPSSGRLFCNIPLGSANRYRQVVRHMPKEIWSEFADLPARCWGWLDPFVYFGDDSGNVYEMHPAHQTDDGKPIHVDLLMAWSRFKTAARKQFKAVQSYLTTDGDPRPTIDVLVNFNYGKGVNVPDISGVGGSSRWDVAMWDVSPWAPGKRAIILWNGVASAGVYGAVRLTADIYNCTFAVTGFDVAFEKGHFGP